MIRNNGIRWMAHTTILGVEILARKTIGDRLYQIGQLIGRDELLYSRRPELLVADRIADMTAAIEREVAAHESDC